ncbi:DUF1499 domain-containing protein [Ilumatobacter sp.]|uniref:DUF1499 domain-containing protein n=1 Tax=Ilumatobacter sp. TaxID=1967498 RepID=UPI003C4D8DCF
MLVLAPVLLAILGVALVGAYLRNRVASDPDEWHVDPLTAPAPSTPNWYRLIPADAVVERHPRRDGHPPVYDVTAKRLATAFDREAMSEGRVEVLAGKAADGFVTYVQRSYVFGFPDYVSVRFIDLDDGGSTIAIFSRSRFGRSDLGVNEKRVARWVDVTTKRLL